MNQSFVRQLLITFACLFPFLFVVVIISASITEREVDESTGNKAARRTMLTIPLMFLVALLIMLLSQNIEFDNWIPFLQIGSGIGLAILGGRLWFIRQRQIEAEIVLYDLGRVESFAVRLIGIVFGLGFVFMLVMMIAGEDMQFSDVGYFAFIGGAAFYWNIWGQGHVFLTKNGVFRFATGLIPWEKIESYEWGGKYKRSLIFNMAKGKAWFPLKLMQHDEVEAIVSQFVPHKSRATADDNLMGGLEGK